MKALIKKMVIGSFIEPVAREVYARVTGNKGFFYDRQTMLVMQKVLHANSNCVDVGCHEGVLLKEMLRFAPQGWHFAFEPIPGLCQGLREAFGQLPKVKVYEAALSDTTGSTTFQHVLSDPAYSGMRRRRYAQANPVIEEITVQKQTLDAIIPSDIPVHFIKIDVEGAELSVLKGAVQTILKNRPVIVFESGLGASECYGTGPDDVYDFLVTTCGLRMFLMADWLGSEGKKSLSLEDFRQQWDSNTNYYFMAHA